MPPDPKQDPVIRDADLLKRLHSEWRECVICGKHRGRLSLHHVLKHPRDDVRGNLVMLCGDGVTGCHGWIEAGHRATRKLLGSYIIRQRPDIVEHLNWRLGGRANAWLVRRLLVD